MITKLWVSFRHWLPRSVWSFPVLLLVLLALATTFKINGSSVGIYHRMLHDSNVEDPDLIFGQPKSVRSDEYLIFSPRVVLQSQTNYPALNENIGSGRELVITPEAPIKDWVGLFRPHTMFYFILPFTNAFAFSWWFGLFALLVSSYFFFLRILVKKKVLAILFSLALSLSPFILWWFQIVLLLSLAYFFMAAILMMRLFNREKVKFVKSQRTSDLLQTTALAYVGASFGLLLYAPFLIPIGLVLAVFITGYAIDGLKSGKLNIQQVKMALLFIALAALIAVIIGAAFYVDRREMIQVVANSVYPGDRKVSSGNLPFSPLYRFFDSFLMPLLPQPPTGSFYTNQSEAANFILLLPFLLLPGILLQAYDYLKNKNINWTLLLVQVMSVLFILRISVPVGDKFFQIFLLDRVPNNRLMIGVGLLGFLQMIYLLKQFEVVNIPKKIWLSLAAIFSVLTFIWLMVFAKYFFSEYLVFRNELLIYIVIFFLAASFTAIIAAFLFKKQTLGAALLLAFTLLSSFYIMPLQKGLTFFESSPIINKIKEVSSPKDSWAVVDNFTFENLPLIAGRHLINGHQPYTDFDFWYQLDTERKFENVYNRQAHALFVSNTSEPDAFLPEAFSKINQDLELVKGNVFKVRFQCSDFFYKNVDFVLATQEIDLSCLVSLERVVYPKATFFIYKMSNN